MSAPLFFMAPGAPTPVAPFSHAVEVDGWCFVTGQMRLSPRMTPSRCRRYRRPDGARHGEPQDRADGLKLGLEHVVFARAYLTDFEANYPRMNQVYASCFSAPASPRSCALSSLAWCVKFRW